MAADKTMQAEKFMFDRSFDLKQPAKVQAEVEEVAEEEEPEPEIEVPTFSEDDLEAAKKEAFEKGKAEALRESATTLENQIVDATNVIGEKLEKLIVEQMVANKDIFSDAIRVSHAVTKKVFPTIVMEQSLPEIESIIRNVLAQVLEEPRVVVHVNPALESPLKERISKISMETHYEGRLIISGDETVAEGDCRIEWSNGGAERNLEDLLANADAIIEDSISSSDQRYVPSPEAYNLDPPAAQAPISDDAGESTTPLDPGSSPATGKNTLDTDDETRSAGTDGEPEQTPAVADAQAAGSQPDAPSATDAAQESAADSETPQTGGEAGTSAPAPEGVEPTEPSEKNSQTNSSEGV